MFSNKTTFLPSSPVETQSRSPSQTQDLGMHRPESGHRNIEASHSRILQCSPSSEPSKQSAVRSLHRKKQIKNYDYGLFFNVTLLTIAKLMEYSANRRHIGNNLACIRCWNRLHDSFLHQTHHHQGSHFRHLCLIRKYSIISERNHHMFDLIRATYKLK